MLRLYFGGRGLRASALALVAALGALASAPASAEPVSIIHARGTTELPERPRTVVTFDLATLDTLDALGVDVAGVPTVNMPDYLSRYEGDETAKVGSLFEPDFEAVNALQPDLIVVAGRSASQYDALSKIAPTVDLTTDAKDLIGTAKRNIRALAATFGKTDEAEERLAAFETSLANLRSQTAGAGRGLLVLTTGNRMSAFGPGSRFGVLHSEFGVTPAAPDLDTANHGEAISNEFILENNPDWLFVIDRDAAIGRGSAAAMLDNELVRQTEAWKNRRVVYLDPTRWYLVGGGLAGLQATVDQIADAMKPTGSN